MEKLCAAAGALIAVPLATRGGMLIASSNFAFAAGEPSMTDGLWGLGMVLGAMIVALLPAVILAETT